MKKWIKGLLLILILQLLLAGCGSEEQASQNANLITKRVLAELTLYENDEKTALAKFEYDDYGRKIKEVKRFPNNKLMYTIDFFYDKKNQLVKKEKVSEKYGVKTMTSYEYDESGNQTLKIVRNYNKKKKLTQEQFLEQKFDENSNLLEKKEYQKLKNGKTITVSYESYKYNNLGLKIEHYKKNAIQHNNTNYFYDSEKREIKVISENKKKNSTLIIESQYNSKLNERIDITSKDEKIISYWKGINDEHGNLIFSENKDGDGKIKFQNKRTINYDEFDRIIRLEIHNEDNSIKHLLTYEYDEYGLLTKDLDHVFSGAIFTDSTSERKKIYDSGKGFKFSRDYKYKEIKIKGGALNDN